MLDARAWLAWALTALIAASTVRNPLYVILLLLVTAVVGGACVGRDWSDPDSQAIANPLHFAAVAVPLSGLFNALTIHFGDTPLFHLPAQLPVLGGPVTLEALTFGIQVGLMLSAVFSAFSVFNQATPVHELVRLSPRALQQVGIVLTIALTLVPHTIRSLKRIRQSQALRGYHMRGLHDWTPIVVPLLVSGLERSMGLAEAMVARGYGSVTDRAPSLRTSLGLATGLLTLLAGWLHLLFRPTGRHAGAALITAGGALVLGMIWLAGRTIRHTAYRPRHWTWRDTVVLVGCAVGLAVVTLPLPVERHTLHYSPFPRLTAPAFDPLVGLALLGLLTPALVGRQRGSASTADGQGTRRRDAT